MVASQRVLGFVAWTGGLLLVTGLLLRLLGRERGRTAASPPIRNLRKRETRRRRAPVGGYADRAFPLIPQARPPPATDARPRRASAEPPPPDEQTPPALDTVGQRRR